MDRIDKKILNILQNQGNISNQELADKVSLSPSPCLRRVKQLEEKGYIKNTVALLNPEKIGLTLTIIVHVSLNGHEAKKMEKFEKTIEAMDDVIECYLLAGQTSDYMLKVIVPDLNEYQHFLLKKLTRIDGVANIHSSFVLRNIIDKTELPLSHL